MTEYLEERIRKLEKQVHDLESCKHYCNHDDFKVLKRIGDSKPYMLEVKDDRWIEYKPVELAVWKDIKHWYCLLEGDLAPQHIGGDSRGWLYAIRDCIKKVDKDLC